MQVLALGQLVHGKVTSLSGQVQSLSLTAGEAAKTAGALARHSAETAGHSVQTAGQSLWDVDWEGWVGAGRAWAQRAADNAVELARLVPRRAARTPKSMHTTTT